MGSLGAFHWLIILPVWLVVIAYWLSIPILLFRLVRQHPNGPNLVRCPDCNLPVSRLATSCPHCGRPSAPTAGG
jgi:predicted amidophosphoribosyltransferase